MTSSNHLLGETDDAAPTVPGLIRRITRRGMIGTTLATALAAPAFAQSAPAAAPAGGDAAGTAVIDVNRARTAPIPIAIPPFAGGTSQGDLVSVISADLNNCGLFRVVDASGVAATAPGGAPDFGAWKGTGAQALVTGSVTQSGDQLRVEFRLWDILPGTQLQGTAYTTSASNWRRIAHIIADVIYQRLLGEKGYFDTRIAYISTTGPNNNPTKRLAIMDQDGANNRFLTDGSWTALGPRFSPTRDQLAFISYVNKIVRVYLFDLGSGTRSLIGNFRTMTFSPRFAPDGNSIIMSLYQNGGANIITCSLSGGNVRTLTSSGAIDANPCYSPDGSQIVFESDRGGDQQLYVMGADGSNVRRISFGAGRYADPVWSPRGDLIAFTRLGSNFAVGVMAPDGSGERTLSESFDVESPTFCPNGRVIMFQRGAGASSRLVSIDITGFNEQPVQTPTSASDPAWSPLLS
ncbi:Tol-Pal system beta propeller repeat protein TolB [Acidisoma silvae]|uniref:Tol-Pal system protein TolB n=1 Tax=Acidisoma silvae TaxID=2802396 RepID=A0A963YSK7_9PROT|nr:Tol-Pal system protein TolB [Acidisoma silvae]